MVPAGLPGQHRRPRDRLGNHCLSGGACPVVARRSVGRSEAPAVFGEWRQPGDSAFRRIRSPGDVVMRRGTHCRALLRRRRANRLRDENRAVRGALARGGRAARPPSLLLNRGRRFACGRGHGRAAGSMVTHAQLTMFDRELLLPYPPNLRRIWGRPEAPWKFWERIDNFRGESNVFGQFFLVGRSCRAFGSGRRLRRADTGDSTGVGAERWRRSDGC